MRGDFSRMTFRPENHFSGVLLQQGRVQLDSEFNEHVEIEAYRDRATARDVIGPSGAPVEGGGFAITAASMLRGVAGGRDAWAVGENGTVLRSAGGSEPLTIETTPAATARLNAVDVVDTSGWAVGDAATILRLAETTWTLEPAASDVTVDLHGVHADADGAWAVGEAGTVLSWNGTAWERQAQTTGVTATLRDVHFVGDLGAAVGDGGTIIATADRGANWTVQAAPEGVGNLCGVFLADAQHAWAVGDQGTVLFFDGSALARQPVSPPVTGTLRAVMSTSAGEATVVGDGGIALAFDDGAWRHQSTGVDRDLLGLAALPDGTVVAVGDDVALIRAGSGGPWQRPPSMPTGDGPRGRTLAISAGDIYVEGIRCEIERSVSLDRQPEPPLGPAPLVPGRSGTYGVFLQVQEQHLTATEREELREVALGGPDSATRTRTVWQAGLVELTEAGARCADITALGPADPSRGRLRARAVPAAVSTKECIVPPDGGYRRLENQLYRVEIHDGTAAGAPTYTWSRENGSVIARLEGITVNAVKKTVSARVQHTGRDAALGFGPEQIVELTDEGRLLRSEPGVLLEIKEIQNATLELSNPNSLSLTMDDFPVNPIVRRWDGKGTVELGTWVELEDGVFVEFADGPDPGDAFRTGDYWTIPARTLSGGVEWPETGGIPRFEERRGPHRHTAPLAIAELDADGVWSGVRDCRRRFPSLTGLSAEWVAYDGSGCSALAASTTVDAAIKTLARSTRIYPLAGSGEDVLPGETVRIRVLVADACGPVDGATVAFGDDRIDRGTPTLDQVQGTTANGVASCLWTPDAVTPTQDLTVTLTSVPSPGLLHEPLMTRFVANLNLATDTAYAPPGNCPDMDGVGTVQAAIDRLIGLLPRLYHVSGDGLEAPVGTNVELRVGVANRCGVGDAQVRFEFLRDGLWGELATVGPDAEDTATCTYQVTDETRQLLRAVLVADGRPAGQPVYFTVSPAEQGTDRRVPAVRVRIWDGEQPAEHLARTVVEFREAEFDTDNLFDPGTDPTALRAPRPGTYIAVGEISWDNTSGEGYRSAEIMLRGNQVGHVGVPPLPDGVYTTTQVTAIVRMDADEQVQLAGAQSSGDTLLIHTATLSLAWLGP